MSSLALGCILALMGGLLVWYALELDRAILRVDVLESQVMALEARQTRLQRMVEKGWSDTLDLTSFDWSRQSRPPEG